MTLVDHAYKIKHFISLLTQIYAQTVKKVLVELLISLVGWVLLKIRDLALPFPSKVSCWAALWCLHCRSSLNKLGVAAGIPSLIFVGVKNGAILLPLAQTLGRDLCVPAEPPLASQGDPFLQPLLWPSSFLLPARLG